jgi:hypothetical protein
MDITSPATQPQRSPNSTFRMLRRNPQVIAALDDGTVARWGRFSRSDDSHKIRSCPFSDVLRKLLLS